MAKGEEAVSLLSSAGEWHTPTIDAALRPGHDQLLQMPSEPARVDALILAYFHDVDRQTLLAFGVACATLHGSIVEMFRTKAVAESYQPAYEEFLSTVGALQRAVLETMRSGAIDH